LETKLEELERIVRNRDAITIEKSADALDEVQHAAERELAIRNLDRESNLLRNVRSALRRIEDGSFGTCLHCEEEISPKRIAAVPWAAYCIQCQEQADRNVADGNEMLDDMLVNAA
jgi:DnaK suppressor protein